VVDTALDAGHAGIEVHVGQAQRNALADAAAGIGEEEDEPEGAWRVGARRLEKPV
jgi:hypothetical protein